MNSQDGSSSPRRIETRPRYRNRREEFYARPQLSPWQRIPRHHRILGVFLVLGVVAASFHRQLGELYDWLRPAVAEVRLVDAQGATIPLRGRADIFETDRSYYRPSPMPCIGTVQLVDSAPSLELDANRFPRSVQVRFHVEGYGVDYVSVELGRRRTFTLRLGEPVAVSGSVVDASRAPVPGARVLALGGNSRGVVLAESETDERGGFRLAGISRHVDFLTLRVLKEGYALAEREHWLDAAPGEEASRTDFALKPVPPVHGEVRLPEGVDTAALRVSVAQQAGISASVGADGRFVIHHLAPAHRYRLLLQGLPAGYTHRRTHVEPGARVRIDVVPAVTLRGQVVSEALGRPLEKVEVWHRHSTRGQERCVTDAFGNFELGCVPVGEVWLNVAPPTTHPAGKPSEAFVDVPADPGFRARIRIR